MLCGVADGSLLGIYTGTKDCTFSLGADASVALGVEVGLHQELEQESGQPTLAGSLLRGSL